ncbi:MULTISPECIES: hypothetical protein [Xanthomonas translucens group]|jgi:hypothetical protein|uniref:Uncharacterized protein n=1 Tax=Xanthomonas graminis pv. graminis TaxID=134874 RepID=A0A1M4JM07_9XANT|nr:hypothetical protein [Xanthomonas translucens]EKU23663.1 hypothetical protein XTG29_03587 [Xanthomonas translucens pv. graminis ART-Xtg29]UKE54307.1 hypothetical protein KFS84_19760 [Xanthomonas translucens pv. graminis]UKE72957.1 hypothetical protein KFS85_18340 [Xanthomonas translucens pv. phleipratensis]WIH08695.1 hypothetical protein KM579_20680 [Xanthomonas translucens pv. graminis]WIH12212.1 hypothetical protein KM563_19875 [Xanthomonas translucens pv. graminis]
MTTHTNDSRRHFLLGTAATAIAAIVPAAAAATAATDARATQAAAPLGRALPETQTFAVQVLGDLRQLSTDLQLIPGQLSEPLALKGNGTYRVKISPTDITTRFGPIYRLTLADAQGMPLEEMNIGSDTTATFTRYGVQVYALSIEQAM